MCLNSIDSDLTKEYKNKKKTIVAYKIVEIDNDGYCSSVFSQFVNSVSYKYKKGINKPDRSIPLSTEIEDNTYTSGFHCYLFRDKAIIRFAHLSRLFPEQFRLLEVFIEPKNVICIGKEGPAESDPCRDIVIVSSKIEIKSLKHILPLEANENK